MTVEIDRYILPKIKIGLQMASIDLPEVLHGVGSKDSKESGSFLAASCGSLSSHFSASRVSFALESAGQLFLVFAIDSALLPDRYQLIPLTNACGPP